MHLILTFVLITFIYCFENKTKKDKPVIIGNDRDSHGCIGSAGYQWSELLQKCIRVFEMPLQLLDEKEMFIVGVVFSNDKSKAEVITSNGNYILTKKTNTSYILESESAKKFLNKKNGKWEFGDSIKNKAEFTERK